jgi:opacity protein-like surface antigen
MMRRFLIPLMLIAWIPAAGNAQTPTPKYLKWEFNIFAGTSSIGDTTHTTPVTGTTQSSSRDVRLKYARGGSFGAGITQSLGKHLAATLEYRFANQPLNIENLSSSIPAFKAGQTVHRIEYSVGYYFTNRSDRLRPYVFAGPGLALFYIHKDSRAVASSLGMHLSSPWKVTMNWGGGAKYLFADHLAINAQISDSISGVPRYGLPKSAVSSGASFYPGFLPDGMLHNWRFSIGLAYQWDKY